MARSGGEKDVTRSLGVSAHNSGACYHRGRVGDGWADNTGREKGGWVGEVGFAGGETREACCEKKASQPMRAPISSFTFMSCPPFSCSGFSPPKNLAERKELRLDKRPARRVGRGSHRGSSLIPVEDIDNKKKNNNNNRGCEIISPEVKEVCDSVWEMPPVLCCRYNHWVKQGF